ncbi:MAG: APC family permease [Acidobacteriota bacterium]
MKSASDANCPDGRDKLLRILGVTFGIAVTIGGMIGLGILRTPGTVAAQLDSPLLIMVAWTLGAIYALSGVFSAAELGVSLPRTGGWYVYARRAFGEYPGFAVGWMDWIAYPATLALVSIAIGEYAASLFPPLAPYVSVTAVVTLLVLGSINWLGLKAGSSFQEIISFLKAAVFIVIVAAAFLVGEPAGGEIASTNLLQTPTGLFAAIIISLQAVIFAYDGWYTAIYFSEESTNPARTIPRSMIWSVLLVAAIYLSVNAALLYALPISELASSTLPVADVAGKIFGVYGDKVVTSLALITLLSLLNANLLTGPRIMYAISRDGLFTQKAAKVNDGGTPSVALWITVLAAIPVILTGTFEMLLAVTAFLFIVLYVSGFLAVIVLRKKEPDLPRPYRAFGYPWTTGVVLLGSFAFLIGAVVTDTRNSLYAIGVMLLSYPFYVLLRRLNHVSQKSVESS